MPPAWRELRTGTARCGLKDPNARWLGIGATFLKGRPAPGLIYSGPPGEVTRDCGRSGWKLDTIEC